MVDPELENENDDVALITCFLTLSIRGSIDSIIMLSFYSVTKKNATLLQNFDISGGTTAKWRDRTRKLCRLIKEAIDYR